MSELSHYDEKGNIRMVDVSTKESTTRRAVASGKVLLSAETIAKLKANENPKGNPLEIARIAGIMAAKKTPELIPLCHQIALSKADVRIDFVDDGLAIEAEAVTTAQTGVEMEALTAVSVAAHDEDLAASAVDCVCDRSPTGDLRFIEQPWNARVAQAIGRGRCSFGDDQSGGSALTVIARGVRRLNPFVVRAAARHRRHNDPVVQFNIADQQWVE